MTTAHAEEVNQAELEPKSTSESWIEDAISMVKFVEDHQLIMRDDSYDKYEVLIQNSASQEKMDRLIALLVDSMFVEAKDITDRFKPYYLSEIAASNSAEHRDSLRVLDVATEGLSDWNYEKTIEALEQIASDPEIHPFAAIRALSIAGYLHGYSGNTDHIVTAIQHMESLAQGKEINSYIEKEINALQGFSAHFTNDPEEMVRFSIEGLRLSYETEGLIYGDTFANNFTHLVTQFGDMEAIDRIDAINRRIAHMTGKDASIFRSHVLCVESAVKHVRTPKALMCLEDAEKHRVENTQSDVRHNIFGMIAYARAGQIDNSRRLLRQLKAIPDVKQSIYYSPYIDWAMSELQQAEGDYKSAYNGLRSYFNNRLAIQKKELGEVSRALRQYSEEKSTLLQERADGLIKQEALQRRVIHRQRLLNFLSVLLVCAMVGFVYLQTRTSYQLKKTQDKILNANQAIKLEARTDQLTRIGNRRAFYEYCNELSQSASQRARSEQITLGLLDLDGFKSINDTYGHDVGDEIIRATAQRLRLALESKGHVFRLGGDEMAIIYLDNDDESSTGLTKLISDGLEKPVKTTSRSFNLKWSVGIVGIEQPDISLLQHLKRADYALYEAKKINGSSIYRFAPEDLENMHRDINLPEEILWNFENDRLLMFGQIVVDLKDDASKPFGVEALLRVQTRAGEPIPVDQFIKHAIALGKADDLTRLTLIKSLDMLKNSDLDCPLMLNLSREQISSPNFPQNIFDILKAEDFPIENLILELSELTLKDDLKAASKALRLLQEKGCRIALDDFGMANAGFSTLFDFSFDIIKTDRALLRLAMETHRSEMLFQNMIRFGQKMNVPCIVEGVETPEELSFVRGLGGEVIQGYMFGIPEEIPRFRPPMFELGDEAPKGAIIKRAII